MFHYLDFLHVLVELNRLTTPVYEAGSGFILFVWPLHSILLGLFLYYFTILRGVSGAMHKAYVSISGLLISWRDYIFVLHLPEQPFLGLVGKAIFSPFFSRHGYHGWNVPLWFLEGIYPLYTCSAIFIWLNMAQFYLKVFISKLYTCKLFSRDPPRGVQPREDRNKIVDFC